MRIMRMVTLKFIRIGKNIRNQAGSLKESFTPINTAKRASRKLQIETDGFLGRGCLQVQL